MSKHLHERGSSFQYRRVFPQDVRTTAGRRELTRSLKVKTKKEAEKINAQEDWGYLDQLAY